MLGVESTFMVPPMAVIRRLVMVRPKPVPLVLFFVDSL